MLNNVNPPLDELAHHGIKGMHWGVRKESSGSIRPTRSHTTMTKEERKAAHKNYHRFADASIDKKFGDSATLYRDPISESEYKKLSNKDEIIKKGRILYRTTTTKNRDNPATYVTTNRRDADVYNVVLAKTGLRGIGGRSYKPTFEATYKSLETLRSPSEKARVDAFVNLMDTPSIVLKNGKTVTGRQILSKTAEFKRDAKKLDRQRLGLEVYNTFLKTQWMDDPVNTAYFKAVRDKGYNAISDDNDRGHLTKSPLILLNPDGSVKRMSVRQLSADEINTVKGTLKPP